ncbi:hypothetical protein CALCODRAFT_349222 [Calocera cornea HHB12733]|uniref:EF-hand domain-containing protein n=1 Tax=Calocera cornea HHB12733 TaxID=1353952 RepID=A0A165JDV2_9BASI|nr:hypothetical protein CALCODRAFT_349222 [Calocera cornea HHB12733]
MDDDEYDDGDMEELPPDDLAALPQHLRDEIDAAFDRVAAASASSSRDDDGSARQRKRRKLNRMPPAGEETGGGFMVDMEGAEDGPSAGGFLPDEPISAGGFLTIDQAGGFLPSSPVPAHPEATHIPLSLIPRALKLLRLQPDDDVVLATFREAATGWGGSEGGEHGVSREDWRAVCAVLVGGRECAAGEAGEEAGGFDPDDLESSLTEDEEDAWQPSPSPVSDLDADADADYAEAQRTPSSKRASKGKGRARETEAELSELTYADLSGKKRGEVREAFALFFEEAGGKGVGSGNADERGKGKERAAPPTVTRRIGAADLARVAKMLNEKISSAEIDEMLEMFTSATDKTVGIQEFSKIMIMGNAL